MTARGELIVDVTSGTPIAKLVYLTAPVGETELDFYKRKAQERSRRIAVLEREVKNLLDAIAVYEEES
jgi:hypothetical protein